MPELRAGETLLWEGRPDTGLNFGIESVGTGIFAGALILACLGMATVINRSMPGMFWPIFGPGVLLGAVIFLGYPLFQSWQRRNTRYALTSQRALIIGARNPGRTEADRNGHPIPPADRITFEAGTPGSVWFGKRPVSGRTGGHCNTINVGFERISDAKAVYALMLQHAGATT